MAWREQPVYGTTKKGLDIKTLSLFPTSVQSLYNKVPQAAVHIQQYVRKSQSQPIKVCLNDVLTEIVLGFIDNSIKVSLTTLLNLPQKLKRSFKFMCKLALKDLICGRVTYEASAHFLSKFCYNRGFQTFDEVKKFGLVHSVPFPSFTKDTKCYQFLHPLLREFLAAIALVHLPPLDQIQFLADHLHSLFEKGHTDWLIFFFGLSSKLEGQFNTTNLMMTTLLDVLSHYLNLVSASKYVPIVISSIQEMGEEGIWCTVANKHVEILTLEVTIDKLQQLKAAVTSMMLHSGVSHWTVEASSENVGVVKALTPVLEVTFIDKESLGSHVKIYPQNVTGSVLTNPNPRRAESQEYVLNFFLSTAAKEILQKVLQLYSKTKLKGDASTISYVSFESLIGFKTNVEVGVKIEPILPIHYLAASNVEIADDETTSHLDAGAKNAIIELIIFLKPYFRSLWFVIPTTTEEHRIILSKECDSDVTDRGAVASSVSALEQEVQCISETADTFGHKTTEMVYPLLSALEKKTKDETQVVKQQDIVNQVDFHHLEAKTTHSLSKRSTHSHSLSIHASDKVRVKTPQTSKSLSQYDTLKTTTNIDEQHKPIAITQVSQKHENNLQPGTVLYTSIPSEIPSDQLQPLPDESQLIKRGGNGSIFAGTICGMSVAIKKTHYRSKEFAIITRISHRNLMPLLAFVLGVENPVSRRRYYCYHIMPRLTGDLARMLTDEKELSLRKLHQTHHDNPRLMGIILGNFKFIIREILNGLSYLHSFHIAHRDIKGSNILLKFYCSCDNPLECACNTKFKVIITDFDAAIQLDNSDCILPTSSSLNTKQPLYHCIPVGTNGYRAPESSMLVITNSNVNFSPPVSTKCDVWSLGILVCRMLADIEGPSSQREMALLLLRYHQVTGMVEGVSRHRIAHSDVDEILKISHVWKEEKWLKNISSFIECSLQVDPLKRHSIDQLRLHHFLV